MSGSYNTITNSWVFFTWISFIVAILAIGTAICYMPIDNWLRAYLGISSLFLLQASVSLSKTLRDQAERKQPPTK